MAYTIARDVCEGIDDCLGVCPTECIRPAEGPPNAKGTRHVRIDAARCIDCGACLSVCPIEAAIVDAWRPELQGDPPGLPCLGCPARVEPGRRFCQVCGAPVAAGCRFEDLALLGPGDLARVLNALWATGEGAEVAVVVGTAAPALAARLRAALPPAHAERLRAGLAGPATSSPDEIRAARHAVTFQLRLLVARGELRYKWLG